MVPITIALYYFLKRYVYVFSLASPKIFKKVSFYNFTFLKNAYFLSLLYCVIFWGISSNLSSNFFYWFLSFLLPYYNFLKLFFGTFLSICFMIIYYFPIFFLFSSFSFSMYYSFCLGLSCWSCSSNIRCYFIVLW